MSDLNNISAKMVIHSAKALAGYAASELLESLPGLGEGSDSTAFQRWQNLFVQCLQELAAAVQFNRPQLLLQYVAWLKRLLISVRM